MGFLFSTEHLQLMKQAEGKTLRDVIYHYWQNRMQPGEIFEFIDKLELAFTDGYRLIIGTDEDEEEAMLLFPDFDAEATSLRLMHQFNGKISLRAEFGNTQALWENCIGQPLHGIRLLHVEGSDYRNNDLLIDFGGENQLEVHTGLEGLVIEPYEEV
jgi:hypothetical protein